MKPKSAPSRLPVPLAAALCVALLSSVGVRCASADWPSWRGPDQNGASTETGLISDWSPDGDNLIWRGDVTVRSTPIALNGSDLHLNPGRPPVVRVDGALRDMPAHDTLTDERVEVLCR
ncbi:MAG: hypothetical protein ABGY41_19945, partial [Candidatus Poribacteria bacterium]